MKGILTAHINIHLMNALSFWRISQSQSSQFGMHVLSVLNTMFVWLLIYQVCIHGENHFGNN
jgi:hypothetical protein